MNAAFEQGKEAGYFHGLTASLLELSRADDLSDATQRLTSLMREASV